MHAPTDLLASHRRVLALETCQSARLGNIRANSNDEDESFFSRERNDAVEMKRTHRFVMSSFEHGIQSMPIVSDECDLLVDICADERSYLISFVYSQASG